MGFFEFIWFSVIYFLIRSTIKDIVKKGVREVLAEVNAEEVNKGQ